MNHVVLAIVCTLVHIPSIFIRYAPFREIVPRARRRLLVPMYTLVLAAAATIYYLLPDQNMIFYHKIMLILVAAVLSLINVVMIPGHWREHLFTAGLASVHVSVTFFTAAYLVLHLTSVRDPERIVAYSSATTLILFLILVRFYCNCARRVVTPFLELQYSDYWKRFWFVPLGLFFACFFSTPLTSYSGDGTILLCRLAILITTIVICNTISDDHAVMRHQLSLAEQLSVQAEYYHDLTERVAEARKSRHDFKHHMAAIRKFIDTDDKSGLTEYWNELQVALHQDIEIPYTGNPALDGVLYRYAVLSRQENIRFAFSGIVEPLVMPDTDLCVLLGNALDNALTACQTLETDRFITVTAQPSAGAQSLMIVNSFDGIVQKENDQILSRKRRNEPGIGLESIHFICEKHGAMMDLRYDDRTFSLLLVIPTQEQGQ